MIVYTEFCDHWKIRRLKRLSNRPEAVEWVIRLWLTCEVRRSERFPADEPEAIADACHYHGDASEFVGWLVDSRFLDREGQDLVVHQWAEHNPRLWSAWQNGSKGGRPKANGEEDDYTRARRKMRGRRDDGLSSIIAILGRRRERRTLLDANGRGGGRGPGARPAHHSQLLRSGTPDHLRSDRSTSRG